MCDSHCDGAALLEHELAGQHEVADATERVQVGARIRGLFSERCFGRLKSYAGARVLITTWDGYLGELRALSATPEDWAFSVADGGPLDAPKIYDHILLDL